MSDSDFAGDIDNRKGQTGWIFMYKAAPYHGGHTSRTVQLCRSTPEAEWQRQPTAAAAVAVTAAQPT